MMNFEYLHMTTTSPKRILVTGAAGFLGSHLCDRLLSLEHTVVGLDNLQTGRKKNIAHLSDNPNFSFVEHDIINPLALSGPFDEIYNLACPASPPHYQANPQHTVLTNTVGIMNVIELAKQHRAKIFQAST